MTLTLGTFKRPGAVIGLLHGVNANTGFCVPHRVIIRVAPSLNIPPPSSGATAGNAFSWVVPRDDGAGNRYWNNGNLSYGAPGVGGLEVVSKPSWMSWTPGTRTLAGTAPNPLTTYNVTFRCTNGAGDYTEQTVDVREQGWTPAQISADRLREKIGRRMRVLVDEVSGRKVIARSAADAPEIDGTVRLLPRQPPAWRFRPPPACPHHCL